MNWKIKSIQTGQPWKSMYAVFVDGKQAQEFGQLRDGRWVVLRADPSAYFLTMRLAKAEALRLAGVHSETVPRAFYES